MPAIEITSTAFLENGASLYVTLVEILSHHTIQIREILLRLLTSFFVTERDTVAWFLRRAEIVTFCRTDSQE